MESTLQPQMEDLHSTVRNLTSQIQVQAEDAEEQECSDNIPLVGLPEDTEQQDMVGLWRSG